MRSVWSAFVCWCFACGFVLELEVCRVRFARVSCLRLIFENRHTLPLLHTKPFLFGRKVETYNVLSVGATRACS